jgi:PPOX class probable F420-dependent enzyme
MGFTLDRTSAFQARVYDQLQHDPIVWLTTVGPAGQPQPSPVWFMWDGADKVIIYSKPDAPKVRNIRANPKVALHFDSLARGEMITIFTGLVEISDSTPPVNELPGYAEKYHSLFVQLETDAEKMAAEFSTALVFTIEKLRGY